MPGSHNETFLLKSYRSTSFCTIYSTTCSFRWKVKKGYSIETEDVESMYLSFFSVK